MISRWTSFVLAASAGLLCIGLAIVLGDPFRTHQPNRQRQRRQDVEAIADLVVQVAARTGSLPPLSAQLQQIGTAETGCALQTQFCQITLDSCVQMNYLTGKKELTLPSDLQIGSMYRTGYAASYDVSQEVLTVVACGAESQAVQTTRSLHGVFPAASASATPRVVREVNGKK